MRGNRYGIMMLGLLVFMSLTSEIKAMPMFTTQMGMDCKACHLQHMPKLNKFGRKFAASGMTLSQKFKDENATGMDVNPSIMYKSIYEKTWDKPSENGEVKLTTKTNEGILSIPRTATLYLGGRLTEDLGGLVNLSYKSEEDHSVSGKIVYAKEVEEGYLGLAFYSSANFGPFSGMEVYNSGLYKPLRNFDIRRLSNAIQATNIGTGASTGFQTYYDKDGLILESDHIFGTIGMYAPVQDNLYMDLASNLLPFARVAYEYPVGDFNLILGAFSIVGGETTSDASSLSIKRKTYGMDFQVEGYIGEKSVALTMSNIFKNEVTYTGVGAGTREDLKNIDNDAFSIEGEINLTPDFGVKLAYMTLNDLYAYPEHDKKKGNNHVNVKDIDSAITVGMDYSFKYYLPMKVAVEHSWVKPSLERVKDYRDFIVTLNMLF